MFIIVMLAGVAPICRADVLGPTAVDPGAQCRQAIAAAEQTQAIPSRLLAAIGLVESGRRDPGSGVVSPWPWTVDADGTGYFYPTKQAAIEAVRAFRASGAHSIDVGCMQVSLLHHPDAFADLNQAFDPVANATWAAGFLRRLYLQTNDWAAAAATYHSATPALAEDYRRKVMAAWRGSPGETALAAAWAATMGGARGFHPFGSTPFSDMHQIGLIPPRRGELPHVIYPQGYGGATPAGRGLAAYRAAPIAIASGGARAGASAGRF